MKVTFLGTGTSTGVPQIGCSCPTCTSPDPCDKRLRASALVEVDGTRLLIDCGPDFRAQMLAIGAPQIDACLLTHIHYDHVGGLDDLRPFCARKAMPIFCQPKVAKAIRERMPYCFAPNPYPGIPKIDLIEIEPFHTFQFKGIEIQPLLVMHALMPIVGFKISNFAYITDCKTMPKETLEQLKGLDTLVINALRHEEHPSHLCLSEALEIIAKARPRRAYLTHMAHNMGPQASVSLPAGVQFAHDFLSITI
ncbi:MAG: MBL fold metallo-hydrolase [Bacteroidales bacterium]|nr:MBL fold metallo-hydrolase [Bacteroidales bacterium]